MQLQLRHKEPSLHPLLWDPWWKFRKVGEALVIWDRHRSRVFATFQAGSQWSKRRPLSIVPWPVLWKAAMPVRSWGCWTRSCLCRSLDAQSVADLELMQLRPSHLRSPYVGRALLISCQLKSLDRSYYVVVMWKIAHQPQHLVVPSLQQCLSQQHSELESSNSSRAQLSKAANSSEELNAAKKAAQDQQLEARKRPCLISLIFPRSFSSITIRRVVPAAFLAVLLWVGWTSGLWV